MKRLITKSLICGAAVAGLFLAMHGTADAAMTGTCVTCHTMHNSQDGTDLGTSTVQDNLLLQGCIGCHTGTAGNAESATGKNSAFSAPVVLSTAAPSDYLAGGNFYWVDAGNDAFGHNVQDLPNVSGADGQLATSPGGSFSSAALGCTNCHKAGGHHTGGSGGVADGSSVADSYRFLSGNVIGVEDANWEATFGSTDHNTYYGNTNLAATNSISGHCAGCHGDFHGSANVSDGTGDSPWTRHPTDFSLASATGGEYADYDTYNVSAPVGSNSTVANFSAVAAGDDIVICLSCHRAHGSPFADMLRWSYTMAASESGDDTTGCFVCHTAKDGTAGN